jgi:hypothetical protein
MPLLLFILIALLPAEKASAYPEFIGYKYSSCITCHFNGQGNGPLNDYGRALWASEIAGRAFSGGRTEEQLGAASGFLGSKELPYWLRPGLKARNLVYQTNPGGEGEQRTILMQAEFNAAILFDRDQKYAFVGSYGHAPIPQRLHGTGQDVDEWISHEHYFRWQKSENWWFFIGLMDKAYGIRTVNHTAYSRAKTGLAQHDQTHGVMAMYIQPKYEVTTHVFAGNLFQDADVRQKGVSFMYDYEIAEAWRLGASALYSVGDYVSMGRLGVHTRRGFGYGNSLMLETGLINNDPKTGDTTLGYYVFSEAMQRVVRGYHAFISGQVYKDRLERGRPENFKMSFGALMFPMQRLEFRAELENTRQYNSSPDVNDEGWALMGQVHISL